jgi:parvulin-like peptidyl-prolyl isomerase
MKQMKGFCIVAASALLAGACAAQPNGFLDGILVVVNRSVITYLQVEDGIYSQVQSLRSRYPNDPTNFFAHKKEFEEAQMESLEESKLILDDYAKGQYSTNWVDDEFEKAIKQDLKKTYGGSQTRLISTLQAMGMTKEAYRKQIRESVIVGGLAGLHSTGKIIISPAAIEKYYNDHADEFKVEDQIKLRMIKIAQPPGSPPGASKQLAAEILRKIDGGVPFAEMAKEFSSDEQHRAAGGDWGWVPRTELVAPLAEAAFSLKPGQRGPMVELPGEGTGDTICYLLMVDDVRPAHVSPLSEVQGAIERTLQDQKGKVLLDQYIQRLKAKSHIEMF